MIRFCIEIVLIVAEKENRPPWTLTMRFCYIFSVALTFKLTTIIIYSHTDITENYRKLYLAFILYVKKDIS